VLQDARQVRLPIDRNRVGAPVLKIARWQLAIEQE